MDMRLSKRGQGLPLTTIIIAIMVIVVLIVIVTFFFSGSTSITDSIKRVFYGTTAGTDLALATENCKAYCQQAEGLAPEQRDTSPYCTKFFLIDKDNSGEADYDPDLGEDKVRKYDHYYCNPTGVGGRDDGGSKVESVGVSCSFSEPDKFTCPTVGL